MVNRVSTEKRILVLLLVRRIILGSDIGDWDCFLENA
jgi:hypothetical protein